jgi:hypothetical protein
MKISLPSSRGGRPPLSRPLAVVGAAALVVGMAAAAVSTSAADATPKTSACASTHVTAPTRIGNGVRQAVVMRPQVTRAKATACSAGGLRGKDDLAVGAPPLYYWGGKVMGTPAVGSKIVVTPIFWLPSGYSFPSGYQSLITRYLTDVAHDSGKNNVFATNTEYSGSNGAVHYKVTVGSAINDTDALPSPECTIDPGSIYSDGTTYNACIDDDQVQAEISNQVASHSLPTDLGHIYVLFTPKRVESCFFSDAEAPSQGGNQCTINAGPTAAYCAYHSAMNANPNEIYANMPFPIYKSAAGYSCTDEHLEGQGTDVIQSPNNSPDADVEISPTSHELSEAFTDPDLNAWYDAVGYENGDECAYVYGKLGGNSGTRFNQTINAHHYLTQEEFSNNDFYATYGNGGCLQGEPRPMVFSNSPTSGKKAGGTVVTVRGADFTPTSSVLFGTAAGKNVKYVNAGTLKVTTPKHKAGTVKVFVKTLGGTSAASSIGTFRFK